MAIIVDIEEAAERLEELLDRACAGEEVSISVNCIPMVWLRLCENLPKKCLNRLFCGGSDYEYKAALGLAFRPVPQRRQRVELAMNSVDHQRLTLPFEL